MRDFRGMIAVRALRVRLMTICRRIRRGCHHGRCLGALVVRRCLSWRFYEFGLGWGGWGGRGVVTRDVLHWMVLQMVR